MREHVVGLLGREEQFVSEVDINRQSETGFEVTAGRNVLVIDIQTETRGNELSGISEVDRRNLKLHVPAGGDLPIRWLRRRDACRALCNGKGAHKKHGRHKGENPGTSCPMNKKRF